jgi:hypothetical protein
VINLKNPRMQGKDLIYDITIIEGTMPQSAGDAVLQKASQQVLNEMVQ